MEDKNVMNVMLGGQFPKELPESNLWCGVDKGALYLIDNGIKPHISCGDFDSINNEQISKVKNYSKNYFVKDNQDETDTDFALKNIIKLYPEITKINLFGATGKRLDHFFGNILFVLGLIASIIGKPNEILGTKFPSITSIWNISIPISSNSLISLSKFAKSADKIDGSIFFILFLLYIFSFLCFFFLK